LINFCFCFPQVRLKSGTYDNFQSDNLKKYKGVMESTKVSLFGVRLSLSLAKLFSSLKLIVVLVKELNELQAQSKLTKHRRMHMEMEYEDGSEVS